ncbi:MAG: methyltransferase, TrmA family [Acidimicrobiaceae bacterium]|nr:methyltransferase, TrmA family [Acidimicrobiaceae bacterium]
MFVRHALPDELVRARVTAEATSYLRADAVEILERSSDRVEPPCRYAGPDRCGGCDFQHVALPAQRDLKSALISEQLRRLAGIDTTVEVEEVPGAPGGLGWRTRVRFAVDGSGRTGFRHHRSHDIEVVDRCLIASGAVEAIGAEQLRWPGVESVEVFATEPAERRGTHREPTSATHAVIVAAPRPPGSRPRDLARLGPPQAGLIVGDETLREPHRLRADAAGHTYRISAGAFWQVHRGAPAVLANAVLGGLKPRRGERALDLFAGVGLFSVLLAEAVGGHGSVVAVERDPRASADARHNVKDYPQVIVRSATVTPGLVSGLGHCDLVVLDPPREGVGREVMATLVALRPAPRRVAYVACDPASFARDLRVALDARWRISSLRAFDQFPMTEHVEIVAILEPPAGRRP